MKVGDTVWVYRPPLAPIEGVISEILDYAVRVNTGERLPGNSIYAHHCIFLRPHKWAELRNRMYEDADSLRTFARKIEKENV